MPHPAQQLVLEEYILEVDTLTQRAARIEAHMIEFLPDWNREPYVHKHTAIATSECCHRLRFDFKIEG